MEIWFYYFFYHECSVKTLQSSVELMMMAL